MSGFEVLGATAAIAQLSELCIKCGQTTVRIIRSYRGAPREITELAHKVNQLEFRIGQVQKIGHDLSDLELDDVFPEIHREILLEQLETHHQALLDIESLATGAGGQGRGKKLQWAFVDKRRTAGIMKDLADVHQTLDQFLEIIPMSVTSQQSHGAVAVLLTALRRLATIQHTSLAALRVSNAALLPALLEHTKEIQSSIQAASAQQSVYWREIRTEIVRCQGAATEPPPTTYVPEIPSSTPDVSAQINRPTGPPPPQVATKKTSRELKSGHEFVDTVTEFHDFGTNRTIQYARWELDSSDEEKPEAVTRVPRYCGQVAVKTTASFREVRASLRVRFFLFNERVLRFELGVRQFTRAWSSFAFVGSRIDVLNVRPFDSRIFNCCRELDFDGVKTMLEQGQASINDVDDETNAGLLEHIMTGTDIILGRRPTRTKARFKLIQYLMHQGCTTHWSSTMVWALREGYTDIVRFMLQQNMSFEMLDPDFNPTRFIYSGSQREFHQQISLLHTSGCTDWAPAAEWGDTDALCGAIVIGSVPDIIYAAEVLKLGKTPWRIKFRPGIDINVAVVLKKSSTSLVWTGLDFGRDESLTHWALLNDWAVTSATQQFLPGIEAWRGSWGPNAIRERRWEFSSTVTRLRHILLHDVSYWDAAGWDAFGQENPNYTIDQHARMWSYYADGNVIIWPPPWPIAEVELCEDLRNPRVSIHWLDDGTIWKRRMRSGSMDGKSADAQPVNDPDVSPGNSTDKAYRTEKCKIPQPGQVSESRQPHKPATNRKQAETEIRRDSSIFSQVISTKEGRRHLSRFPLVKALCCALQLAGYRAEMDDDGDIWFEDDDGDQYFDAVEHPSEHDRRGPLGGTCEMCRDPERFGLGWVIDKHEDAVRKWRHERQIFVERGLLQPLPEDEQSW
ncbi:hypothetical protein CDEST_14359 [Colletotrichum destructivum]|uniref:Fungal N-terminal domain-containing protein n=1 Tax=Colletotrichum destructivum TaxID=34406 RepID=A0AAX4J1Y0_9PEZI|nr:hypothetical protein CDEST_14359 [Colletotrichum destructivum]